MKVFYISLLATVLISSVLTVKNPCFYVQSNIAINDPRRCDGYFVCSMRKTITAYCSDGLWYDKITGECKDKSEVVCNEAESQNICKNACNNEDNSCFIADEASCYSFFYCNKGKAELKYCGGGLGFDPVSQSCGFHTCPVDIEEQTLSNVCVDIPNDKFVRDAKNCAKYYQCYDGKPMPFICSTGEYFDTWFGKCEKADKVQCEHDQKTMFAY